MINRRSYPKVLHSFACPRLFLASAAGWQARPGPSCREELFRRARSRGPPGAGRSRSLYGARRSTVLGGVVEHGAK